MRQNMEAEPPSIAERVPGLNVNPRLEALARRLMAKRPQDRYQSAAEVVAVLDSMQAEWTAPPRQTRARPRMVTVQLRRPSRWVRIATVAMSLVALGIGVALFQPDARTWMAGVIGELRGAVAGPDRSAPDETAPAPGSALAELPASAGGGRQGDTPAADQAQGAPEPGAEDAPPVPDSHADPDPEPGADPAGDLAGDPSGVAAAPDAPRDQDTSDAPGGRDEARTGRRRPGRNRRDARGERTPVRDVAPPPVQDSADTAPEEVSAGELNRLFSEVGDLLERLTNERGGPAAEALSREYFDIPIGTAQVNVKQRKDAWVKLQRLRRQARQALAE